MFIDLNTKRLKLKCIDYDDAIFMYNEFSNDDINTYLYDAEPISSIDEAKEWIDFYLEEEPRNQHRWIIINKSTNEKIGTCGFHCWDRLNGTIEIGYDLQPSYWHQGYTTEALITIIDFAKEVMKVKVIKACIAENNKASINTITKLGFYKTNDTYYEDFHDQKYLHYIYQKDL